MNHFSIGEIAIYVGDGIDMPFGAEVEILSNPLPHPNGYLCHDVACPQYPSSHHTKQWAIQPKRLRKKPKPRECDKLLSWDDCDWRPAELTAI